MKSFISCSVLIAMMCGIGISASAETTTKEVAITMNDAFVPDVVDKSADAKIVLNGMFSNSCYSWSRSEVMSPTASTHQIKAFANLTVNTMCLMMMVPYSKEVNLGRLPIGQHTIRFVNGDETYFERTLTVQ